MDDLTRTLRNNADSLNSTDDPPYGIIDSLNFAANEIERLRAELAEYDWQDISTVPGVDGPVHTRGLFVKDNRTGKTTFEQYTGYVSEDGYFEDESWGEDVGWRPEEFEYWMPLPKPPESPPPLIATRADMRSIRD